MIDEGPIKKRRISQYPHYRPVSLLVLPTLQVLTPFVINSSLLPIRRSATDADIEIFGSDVVLR